MSLARSEIAGSRLAGSKLAEVGQGYPGQANWVKLALLPDSLING